MLAAARRSGDFGLYLDIRIVEGIDSVSQGYGNDAIATPRSRRVSVDAVWDAGEGVKGRCSFGRWAESEIVGKRGCCHMVFSCSLP